MFRWRPVIDVTAILVCVVAFGYAVAAALVPIRPVTVKGSELLPVDISQPEISGTGFSPNAVFGFIAPPPHVTGIPLYGSAPSGDASMGDVKTRWYQPFRHFYMLIAGYTVNKGCEIYLEVVTPKGGLQKVPIPFDENPEAWRLQRLSLAAYPDATKFRIVAADRSTTSMGWLGFSLPFNIPKQKAGPFPTPLQLQFVLTLCCMCAALAGVLGPGIVARVYFPRLKSTVWLAVPGILTLALLGLLVWLGPAIWPPALMARFGLALLFAFTGYVLIRHPLSTVLSTAELRVLGVILLVFVIAVAKTCYSIGPSGELFKGQTSHNLEADTRSDSRISYHIVHLIALRQSGHTPLAMTLFAPWSFSDRGPIAALAASSFVLCPDVKFPETMPIGTWTLFDQEGVTAYRIAMMALAACSLCVVFGLASLFLDEPWAMLAFLCAVAAPFTIHEIFFTWPKLLAGTFVLVAAYLSLRRRFFAAGFAIGLGYLCHPSALLPFPAILALTLMQPATWRKRAEWVAFAVSGLALWVGVWRWVNNGYFTQGTFFAYFIQTYPFPPPFTVLKWLHSRLIDFSMTLVPLNVFLFHRLDPEATPYDRAPNAWVQFMHQYWVTLPFGVGILFYLSVLRLTGIGFVKAKRWAWLVIVPPFALFLIYLGCGTTGLMREGLHAWALGLILFAVVMWKKYLACSKGFWIFTTIALGFRGVETILMLVPFSAWTRGYFLQRPFVWSDVLMLLVMVSGTVLLTKLTVWQCRRVRFGIN